MPSCFGCFGIHPQGVLKRASLKLLEMFCVHSRCLAAWNLDLWCVFLVQWVLNSPHQKHTPEIYPKYVFLFVLLVFSWWKETQPDWHILIDSRWHSSILDVLSFRWADCDTDHYLVVAKVRERLAVINKQHRSLMGRNLISGS